MTLPPMVALLDAALPIPRVSDEEDRRVRFVLRLVMPPGLPSDAPDYVVVVRAVTWLPPERSVITAMLFDGGDAILSVYAATAPGGDPRLVWHRHPFELPFGYDRALGRWRRYPELMGIAAAQEDAIARLDVEGAAAAARAERNRARALKAAETRRRNRAAADALVNA